MSEHTLEELQEKLEREPSEDAISRQALLEAFGLSEKTRKYGGDHSGYDTLMKYEIQDILEDLPPVTPQQKIGHWIEEYIGCMYDVCSECGQKVTTGHFKYNYCPNCGTKMESDLQK